MKYSRTFYEEKFCENDTEDRSRDILLNSITNTLTEEEKSTQSGPFIMKELYEAKNGMTKGKSPGNDGLTIEFYIQCWEFIHEDILEVMNEIAVTRKIPLSMTQAIITLIFKNKGNREDLTKWRTISLCNVDYKILTIND